MSADPISIATGVITFAQLFCSITSAISRFSGTPDTLRNIDADCKLLLRIITHNSILLFGRREWPSDVRPPAINMEEELALRISMIQPAVENLIERIQSVTPPAGHGPIAWMRHFRGQAQLRKLEEAHEEIKRQMNYFNQLRGAWTSAILLDIWYQVQEMSRRSSVTSATSDSSSPVSTTCGQFTPSTDSWEPLPIQQHPVDYSKADLLSDSLIKEGQQTLLRLIDDLPPENSTSESRMTRLRGLSVIETLICAGNIQPEFETGIGDAPSPLHLAVRKRDAALVELLLRYGASMGTRNSQGETALHVATRTDDLDMVKALLSDDIRFSDEIPIESPTERANKLNNQGHPALWWAAAEGSSNEVFKYLLTLGPEVVNFQCEDVDLPTALWAAASLGRLDEARALLRNGADPMVRDRDQSTLLHKAYWPDMAHRSGFDAAGLYVDLLERPNIDAAARDREGRQPIHFAAAAGELAMCRALLNHLRDRAARQPQQDPDAPRPVDAGDNNGATPLMFAAGTGQIRVVRMLIAEYQADVRAVDRYGSDAFAAACERGFLTTAVLLLGAYPERDLDMMNQSGETALARAQRNGHTNVVNWLVELGARTG